MHLGQSVTSHLPVFPSNGWLKAINSHSWFSQVKGYGFAGANDSPKCEQQKSTCQFFIDHHTRAQLFSLKWTSQWYRIRKDEQKNVCSEWTIQPSRTKPQVCVFCCTERLVETELIGFKDIFVLKSSKRCGQGMCVHTSYAQSLWICAIWLACKLPDKKKKTG